MKAGSRTRGLIGTPVEKGGDRMLGLLALRVEALQFSESVAVDLPKGQKRLLICFELTGSATCMSNDDTAV